MSSENLTTKLKQNYWDSSGGAKTKLTFCFEDDSLSSQNYLPVPALGGKPGILHRGTCMGTYNGCLLIPLTALQDLSYVAAAALLVRPSQGFTLGCINTPPAPPTHTHPHSPKEPPTHTLPARTFLV